MKTRFVFNPNSGRNHRRPGLVRDIRDFIATRSLDADFTITDGPGHATELAREAVLLGCDLVVAVGGDGTVNEVAQALLRTPTALALVPCGSGNGLARHLRFPRSTLASLEMIAGSGGIFTFLDTGIANGRPFFNAMGLGLDAEVSRRFNAQSARGLPAYARTALAVIRELRHETIAIACGSQREIIEVLLLAVANSDQYGNNARIAPGACADDGLLDLVAVAPAGLAGAAQLAARLFLGNIDRSAKVRRWRGSRFSIERAAPGVIHTDGETHVTAATIDVALHPRCLRVLVPRGTRAALEPADAASGAFLLQLP